MVYLGNGTGSGANNAATLITRIDQECNCGCECGSPSTVLYNVAGSAATSALQVCSPAQLQPDSFRLRLRGLTLLDGYYNSTLDSGYSGNTGVYSDRLYFKYKRWLTDINDGSSDLFIKLARSGDGIYTARIWAGSAFATYDTSDLPNYSPSSVYGRDIVWNVELRLWAQADDLTAGESGSQPSGATWFSLLTIKNGTNLVFQGIFQPTCADVSPASRTLYGPIVNTEIPGSGTILVGSSDYINQPVFASSYNELQGGGVAWIIPCSGEPYTTVQDYYEDPNGNLVTPPDTSAGPGDTLAPYIESTLAFEYDSACYYNNGINYQIDSNPQLSTFGNESATSAGLSRVGTFLSPTVPQKPSYQHLEAIDSGTGAWVYDYYQGGGGSCTLVSSFNTINVIDVVPFCGFVVIETAGSTLIGSAYGWSIVSGLWVDLNVSGSAYVPTLDSGNADVGIPVASYTLSLDYYYE